MNRLPLSWCRNEAGSPSYHTVHLPLSGVSWISTAEIPFEHSVQEFLDELLDNFPRFVIRGVSAGSAEYLKKRGAQVVRTGAEAVLNLKNTGGIKRSVRVLARRGERFGSVLEVPYTDYNAHKISGLTTESTHGSEPNLSYLYRQGFDKYTRCFVFSTPHGDWLGAITISFSEFNYAHTESILRRQDAPVGVMEALFTGVIDILKNEGYSKFSLGEVPFVKAGKAHIQSKRFSSGQSGRRRFTK